MAAASVVSTTGLVACSPAAAAWWPKLPKGAEVRQVQPRELRFTHDSISPAFRSGLLLDKAVDDIREGRESFKSFPPLEVTERDGKLWSLSNRRLFVSRVLESLGVLKRVTIWLLPFDSKRVQHLRDGRSKFDRCLSTLSDGAEVRVRSRWLAWQRGRQAHAVAAPNAAAPSGAVTAPSGAVTEPSAVARTARAEIEGEAKEARKKRPTIFTLGYSGRQLGDILSILKENEITGLIDVRENPWSQRQEFSWEHLGSWCDDHSVAYWWVGNDIGGKTENDVRARVRTREGQATLDDIWYQLDGDTTWAIICLEKRWKDCAPRCMLHEEMMKRGVHVTHLGPRCNCAAPRASARQQSGETDARPAHLRWAVRGTPAISPPAAPSATQAASHIQPPATPCATQASGNAASQGGGAAGRPARRWGRS